MVAASGIGPRCRGNCKWFNSQKGYGFIGMEGESDDVFVHQSDIHARGFRSLCEGEMVEFDLMTDNSNGRKKARNVTGPSGEYVIGDNRSNTGGGGGGQTTVGGYGMGGTPQTAYAGGYAMPSAGPAAYGSGRPGGPPVGPYGNVMAGASPYGASAGGQYYGMTAQPAATGYPDQMQQRQYGAPMYDAVSQGAGYGQQQPMYGGAAGQGYFENGAGPIQRRG